MPYLFRAVAVEYRAAAAATLQLSTDMPTAMAVRETITLPSTGMVRSMLPTTPLSGTTRGKLFDVRVTAGADALAVFRIGFYVRSIGRTPSDWFWHWVQVVPSPEQWIELKVPVPPTSEDWADLEVPVPPTSEQWQELDVFPDSQPAMVWYDIPMDQ